MRRALLWPICLLLAAAGLLAGHELAYALAGEGDAGVHGYLAHAPQLLLVLALPAALLAAAETRRRTPPPAAFALVGISGYVAMEHLERLAADGLPWLLTSRVFLLGLVLQLPFALGAWWLARSLLRPGARCRRRPPRAAGAQLEVAIPGTAPVAARAARRPRLRAPPAGA